MRAAPSLADIAAEARRHGLTPRGAFHPDEGDGAPPSLGTIVLLGPEDPAFWPIFQSSDEYRDRLPEPLDRWSTRVIGGLACQFGAAALYPFGGPPYQPFTRWALRCGATLSPVGLLAHETSGLLISYRGALAFDARLDVPALGASPCRACAAPCLTACPVAAMTAAGYDLARCHAYLDTGPGHDCRENGCAVRRACPVVENLPPPRRSAFHMTAFHDGERR